MGIKTYVEQLDEKIPAGIPEKHIVLIAGTPGTMKSTLVFCILYWHAKEKNEKSVYISLEQSRESLLFQWNNLGLRYDDVKNYVYILDIGYIRKMLEKDCTEINWFEAIVASVKNFVENEKCKIVCIDSMDAIYAMSDIQNPRCFLFHFFSKLREMGATTFLISEMDPDSKKFGKYGVEDFLADGVIHISLERTGRVVGRYISVVKMRGVKHPSDYFPLVFENGKFMIVSK
ncbi:MAG: RAD55 family ATPase [Thermoplasmata archaeon]